MPNLEDDDQDHDGAGEFSFYLNKTIIWIHTNKQQALNKACLSNV